MIGENMMRVRWIIEKVDQTRNISVSFVALGML